MEENVLFPWIQTVYTRHDVTKMYSHPFSLSDVLASLFWATSNLKNGAPFLYVDPGVVADYLTTKLCVFRPSLVGVNTMRFLCSLWQLT